jgi:two-component system osmolarity sensor histidine kinase EnvZ
LRFLQPSGLFGRTAALIAATLIAFVTIMWFAIGWTIVVPTSPLMADLLEHRISDAIDAAREQRPMPRGARLSNEVPRPAQLPTRLSFVRSYMNSVAMELNHRLNGAQVVITNVSSPLEVRVKVDETTNSWVVLTWYLARPRASTAVFVVFLIATLLVLGASSWWARRLSLPLASLANAANRVAVGEKVTVDIESGPREVRSLAAAFQSMSQRLHEAAEQREFMLAGVSHDLRSPLARVRVALELIDRRDAALTENMAREIEEMDRMIGLFLHYVRANYNETPQLVVADEVIRAALPVDQRITFELDASEARVLPADALRRIASNLVHNALDHGRPPVRVRTKLSGDRFELAVSDAGEGLSADDWRQALEPFNRLRAQPNTGHAGLGLALIDRLVKNIGGTLAAHRAVGEFTIVVTMTSRPSEVLSA